MAATVFSRQSKQFDPLLAKDQLEALQHLFRAYGAESFCRNFVMILTKVAQASAKGLTHQRLIPFSFNRMQRDMQNTYKQNNITLKMRQGGSTTWHIICRLFLPAILNPGTGCMLLSQTKPYGAQHFLILKRADRYFARNPVLGNVAPHLASLADDLQRHLLHKKYSGRHELLYDFLDSKILVETAENPAPGGGVTLQHLVSTESAYYPGEPEVTLANVTEAIPKEGTKDLESTPNGMGGYFFEEWHRAKEWPNADYCPHFYSWWWQEGYRLEGKPVAKDTLTEEERDRIEKFAWDLEQVAWRRTKKMALRKLFDEKYPEDDVSCFLSSGQLFFDRDTLREKKLELMNEKPLETYRNGTLLVYKRPIRGRKYIVGADVAEGREVSTDHTDANAAVVIDQVTGEECAAYWSKIPPEDLAEDLVEMAEMYNNALIAPERNGPGGTVVVALQRHLTYSNVYEHREWSRELQTRKKQLIPVPGFPTNTKTRPIALNELAKVLRTAPEFFHDEDTIDEMLVFVRDKKGKPAGAEGCHDDRVLARAVAYYVRQVQLGGLDPVSTGSQKYGETGNEEDEDAE